MMPSSEPLPLEGDLDSAVFRLKEMLNEVDKNLEGCRQVLDRLQPPHVGRIEMHWRIRTRPGGLSSYLVPQFTKLACSVPRTWEEKISTKRGASRKKPKRNVIWYQRRIKPTHLTFRVRTTSTFMNVAPSLEDLLGTTSNLLKIREEIVKAIMAFTRVERSLFAKHETTIGRTRSWINHLDRVARPYLRGFPNPAGIPDMERPLIDGDRLASEDLVLTRHGPVPKEHLLDALQRPFQLPPTDVFAHLRKESDGAKESR